MPRVVPSQIVNLIDKVFPPAKDNKRFYIQRSHSIHCAVIIGMVEQLPAELLVLQGDQYIELISAVTAIKTAIEDWKYRDYPLEPIPGLRDLNPISLIRDALSMCPDEFPSKDTTQLIFIEDNDLRINLEIDISVTNKALSNGEWKAATVIAGSVIEALLFWTINQHDQKDVEKVTRSLVDEGVFNRNPGNNLEEWSLHLFTEAAAKLKIIEDDTASQVRLAKEFRNLIHPGREKRLNRKCDRGTALAAVAAAELVMRDLSSKL